MKVHYHNKAILIRDFIPDDAQGIYELDTDPEVMRFLGGVTMTSIEEAHTIVEDILWQYREFGMGRWAIADKQTNEFIGWTGLKRERKLRPEFVYVDLGYRLKKAYWNRGIATETAAFALQHGFNNLNLQEICAATNKDHRASQSVLQRIGLRSNGTFNFMGKAHHWYSITQKQWSNWIPKPT